MLLPLQGYDFMKMHDCHVIYIETMCIDIK